MQVLGMMGCASIGASTYVACLGHIQGSDEANDSSASDDVVEALMGDVEKGAATAAFIMPIVTSFLSCKLHG